MPEQYRALQGFLDTLPDEQPYWRFIETTATKVAESYGYRRIETPVLEDTGVFRKSSGETSDIVEKEMYTFNDRADKDGRSRSLTVRPEGTAGVMRAYLEHGLFTLPQPVKLYYLREVMLRHDRPQAGRYRAHYQFGCEVLGEEDPAIDAEIVALLYQLYNELGLHGIRAHLNSIGDANCRPQYIAALQAYYRPLLAQCCQDCQARFEKNPLRLLDCKNPQDQPKIAAAPRSVDYLCDPCREHFDAVKHYLAIYGVPFELNPLLVRGLDYYTRTVFEFTSDVGNQAISSGGRYDGLAEVLGGQHTPGIGFGMGYERIILEMKRQGAEPPPEERPRAFVAYLGRAPELKDAAVQVTAHLRHAGIKTEMSYGGRSPKAQMKQANSSGAAYAVLLGENELAGGFVTVRNLQAAGMETEKKQIEVPRDTLVAYLNSLA